MLFKCAFALRTLAPGSSYLIVNMPWLLTTTEMPAPGHNNHLHVNYQQFRITRYNRDAIDYNLTYSDGGDTGRSSESIFAAGL